MKTALLGIAFAVPAVAAFASDQSVTQRTACDIVKARAAANLDEKVAGPASQWTCGYGSADNPDFYIIRLNSGQPCGNDCSGLLGWFAVRKNTGQAFYWDIGEGVAGKPLL